MSVRHDDIRKMSDRQLARLAGEQIIAENAAKLEQLRQQGEALELDETALAKMQQMQQLAWEQAENEKGNEAYYGRRLLGWLGNYAATAAVLVLLLLVTSSATAFALGRDVAEPERETDTPALQAALAEYGIEQQLAPRFLPEPYEEAEVSVYDDEEGGLRVFTAWYFDRALPEHIAEGNRLPLCIMIRQHFKVESWAKEPELGIANEADGAVKRLVVTGITYYIGESRGVHWLAWQESEFECVIAGYFSAEDAEHMAYLMNSQNRRDSQIEQEV